MRLTQLAFIGLSLVACRGGGGDDDDDNPTPDGPPPGGDVTIQEVQNEAMAPGTPVTLSGVVVTAVDAFGAKTGDLWVGEPGGGEFSGVKVFGAPLDQVASLQPGDIVTISNAEKDEFACSGDICGGGVFDPGQSITEIKGAGGGALVVTKTGTGTLPPASTVDAKALSELPDQAARDAELEKWEGVLINLTNARQLGSVSTFGGGAPDQKAFNVTGIVVVESVLSDFPDTAVAGTCYSGIVGIGDYFFDYLLLPTSTDNFTAGGSGCTTLSTATIAEVQDGTATGAVQVNDVFVTGVSFDKKKIWIASSLNAAVDQAVFVFGNAVLADDVVVGAKVDVLGTIQEFNDDANGTALTELTFPAITVKAAPTIPPVPVTGKTAAQLLDPTVGAAHESVLVTLTNVNLMAFGSPTNGFIGTAVQNGTTFGFSTDIQRPPTNMGGGTLALGCYTTITGFWTALQAPAPAATTKPNALGFVPATLGATGAGCN